MDVKRDAANANLEFYAMKDLLYMWIGVLLMASSKRSMGAGMVLRRALRRAGAEVLSPLNHLGGLTLKVGKKVLYLRGFRTSDFEVFYQIFSDREYEGFCRYLFAHGTRSEDAFVFVDGGANIGLASAYIQTKFPKAKFFGIEPSEESLHVAALNAAYETMFPKAMAAVGGTRVSLHSPTEKTPQWALRTSVDESGSIETIALADLIDKLDSFKGLPWFLKLDIEGAEFEVLRCAAPEEILKFSIIIVEIHDFAGDSKLLIDRIIGFGYFAFPMGEYWVFQRMHQVRKLD